jgi:hypothetical protein
MTPERWLPIAGYEGFYEVSDLGRVRSLDRVVIERGGKARPMRGRILKPSRYLDGYLIVSLCNDRHHTRAVHDLVARAFHGEPAPGQQVCHFDGDKTNNLAANLRWDTQSANNLDAVRHGTHGMAVRTHCPQGHEYSTGNTYVRRGRNCIKCHRAADRRYRDRKRAAA